MNRLHREIPWLWLSMIARTDSGQFKKCLCPVIPKVPNYLFKNFMAASRKPNLKRFALMGETQDLSWIDAAPDSGGSGGPLTTVTVSSSATPTFDVSQGQAFEMTLTADVTSSSITNPADGQQVYLRITQDSAGHHAFAFPPNMLVEVGFQVDQRPFARTWMPIMYTSGKWDFFAAPNSFLTI